MICKGSLFYLHIDNRFVTEDGLTTIHYELNTPVLYEKISLDRYPSSNDFHGKTTKVSHGEPVLVLEFIGKPDKIRTCPNLNIYDVSDRSLGIICQKASSYLSVLFPQTSV